MKTRSAIAIGLVIAIGFGLSCPSLVAQPANRDRANSAGFVAPPPPPDIGTPGQRRADAGGRPQGCKQADRPLTAVVPVYAAAGSEVVWSVTVSQQPTFWFYVPYASPSASGEFVLENPVTKQQTIQKVALAAKPGIMQVPLENTAASLAVGQPYHWYFNVYCQRTPDDPDGSVEGNVTRQRPNPAMSQPVNQPNLPQQVAAFAKQGVWHEALTAAAVLHCAHPENSAWTDLLRAIGLGELASEPIVSCQNSSPRLSPRQP